MATRHKVIPAGLGCSFDVLWDHSENSHGLLTQFDDGRTMVIGHGEPIVSNPETGKTYIHKSRFRYTDIEQSDNTILEEGGGRIVMQFWPGDQGPMGEVGEDGGLFALWGEWRLTVDLDTFIYTSFEFNGTLTNVCLELS